MENNNKWGRGRGSGEGRGEGAGGSVVNLTGGQTDFYMVDLARLELVNKILLFTMG